VSLLKPRFFRARRQRAVETWRDAARVVWMRWELFRDAGAANRAFAFASYLAAVDAEETAAMKVAALYRASGLSPLPLSTPVRSLG
jgi:hypothetical protein